MHVKLLGPVEATVEGRPVPIGAGKPRALLALLALRAGSVVPADRLIEGLWGEEPPATANKLVQLHVSQLRKALMEAGDGAAILTRAPGYELDIEPGHVDAQRFEELVASGTPREALAMWSGPPLHDVAEPFAAAEVRRLEELRLTAIEDAIDADLVAGRDRDVAAELDALVREEPLRERLQAQRMLALYRCGRQAEALEAYTQARAALVEEIGVEPGPELRRLHEEILRQDPSLEQARSRLGEAADRVAAGRPALRAAEDDLVGGIVALQAAHDQAVATAVVVCPFKGLASFDVDDAAFFFGRERLVAELVARQTGAPLTGLVGASGSGKSSLLRAGVVAALSAGVLPGSERWAIALLRPGTHPVRALEEATDEAAPTGRLVVAVDQFEELFTACRDEDERAAFVDALVASARDPRRRALVLLAIRADFYGRCAAYPELARLLAANHVLVGPMRRDELRRAIELPARRAGLTVEPGVTDALLVGVEGEPGGLPLLSTSLLELWQRRDGHVLRLAEYERVGGVEGAVARLAERAYSQLAPEQQQLARRMLLRLVGEGEAEAAVRRSAPLAEVGAGDDAAAVLEVLADGRLVTVGDDVVELAHEALLREWPRLRAWLEEDVEGRRLHRHLTDAAADWQTAGREPSVLYRGARLASALDWSAAHGDELNVGEREFLEQSRAAAERDEQRQRQANRRLRALLVGVAALLALAVVAGVVAVSQRGEARDAALEADAARVGADGVTREALDDAMLLARAGIDLDDSVATRSSLLAVLLRSPGALSVLPADGWPMFAAGLSPDGRIVATGTERGTVTFYDARTLRPIGAYQADSTVQNIGFSADGTTAAVAWDLPPGAMVDIVDVRARRRPRRIELPPVPGNIDGFVAAYPMFSPDGDEVIVAQSVDADVPGTVRRYDATTGAQIGGRLSVASSISGVAALDGGRRLLLTSAEEKETTVVDTRRLRVLDRFPVGNQAGGVSADGRTAALGSEAGEVRLLDLRTGRTRALEGAHDDEILRVAFAGDGRTVVTSTADGRIGLWDVRAGALRDTLTGHDRVDVHGLQASPDGRTAYSVGSDGRAFAWDVTGGRRIDVPFDPGEPFVVENDRFPRGFALSPDGRTLAQGQVDGTIELLDARTLRRTRSFRALKGFVAAIDFSPDGAILAAAGDGGELALWDARTLRRIATPTFMRTTSQEIAFSPDGRLLAAAELGSPVPRADNGRVWLWDVRRRALTRFESGPIASASVAFSPDGRRLAAAGIERGTYVYNVDSGRRIARLHIDEARSVAFSPDGRLLVTGEYSGVAQPWDTTTWKPTGRRLEAHTARVMGLSFTSNGRVLATAAGDGTVQLWDVASQKVIGPPVTVEGDVYLSTAFSPDGTHLYAAGELDRGVRLNVSGEAWKRQACRVAGRPMTPREWNEALPDRDYRPVCAGS